MMKQTCRALLVSLSLLVSGTLHAAGDDAIKEMRIDPSDTRVAAIGKARLSVEPLVHADGTLRAPYKVEVSRLPVGDEEGQFTIKASDADLHKLTVGQSFQFSGQAVSKDGNTSEVHGTATPSSADGGVLKVRVDSKKGRLVFNTTYHLSR